MSQVQIRDSEGFGIALINFTVSTSDNPDAPYIDDFFTDYAGNSTWPRIGIPHSNVFFHVNYYSKNDEYVYKLVPVDTVNDIVITLDNTPIQEVHIDGDDFKTEDSKIWKMRYGTNFMLAQLVAEGVDISDRLYPNLNGFRITGMYSNISQQVGLKPFHPKNYPNWLNAISDTFDKLATKNFYGKLDLFCDLQLMDYSINERRQILNDTKEMLKTKKNGFGHSLGNENQNNGFDANDFSKPDIPFATGSGLTGGPAPLSNGQAWDYQYQHLRRDIKMFIDIPPVDAPTYNLQHKLLFDETIGYWDQTNVTNSSRTGNRDWAYKMGRIMSAFNGGVIHLHHGIHSEVMPPAEQDCIDEFCNAFE